MKTLYTPKQIANAIGVSESSIKRWCDKGRIFTKYTDGGHRRIAISGLLSYLRGSKKHDLINPRVIGLPERYNLNGMTYAEKQDTLVRALLAGNEKMVRQISMELYLSETGIASICDNHFSPAFSTIGSLWQCGRVEVFQERLACQMAQRALDDMKLFISESREFAPIAIGGTPQGDHYSLATSMVEMVLNENGWQATSLGPNIPLASFGAAIRNARPKLFWLSATHLESPEEFIQEYNRLHHEFSDQVCFVIGGQAFAPEIRNRIRYSIFCDNLQQLANFVSAQQHYQRPTVQTATYQGQN